MRCRQSFLTALKHWGLSLSFIMEKTNFNAHKIKASSIINGRAFCFFFLQKFCFLAAHFCTSPFIVFLSNTRVRTKQVKQRYSLDRSGQFPGTATGQLEDDKSTDGTINQCNSNTITCKTEAFVAVKKVTHTQSFNMTHSQAQPYIKKNTFESNL